MKHDPIRIHPMDCGCPQCVRRIDMRAAAEGAALALAPVAAALIAVMLLLPN